jgi:hypothetical protein
MDEFLASYYSYILIGLYVFGSNSIMCYVYVQPKLILQLLCRSSQYNASCCCSVRFMCLLEIVLLSNRTVACLSEMASPWIHYRMKKQRRTLFSVKKYKKLPTTPPIEKIRWSGEAQCTHIRWERNVKKQETARQSALGLSSMFSYQLQIGSLTRVNETVCLVEITNS